ncbi:hypothetical protein KIN20_021334 [Parelaphostrongylus tenuis]|uniref:Uncharacterized protein n=1 Tax=Parelaphostrongylus tenuis TaxID=148309 RepID=A0AAD5QW50_PARTN|nr:hypothetical protein KIN20_021334 [Parelaphostrongylus tenuis]
MSPLLEEARSMGCEISFTLVDGEESAIHRIWYNWVLSGYEGADGKQTSFAGEKLLIGVLVTVRKLSLQALAPRRRFPKKLFLALLQEEILGSHCELL